MWKAGDKLVCIRDKFDILCGNADPSSPDPKKGEIVVLKGFSKDPDFIYIQGYDKCPVTGCEISYDKEFFRPIQYSGNAISEILEKFKPLEK
jgi:hypothetical protein